MNSDSSRAYEMLGVKPGVSNVELKAAHRDLAKVWHPDRFLHDPRLQAKAQEKLKEINQAYEQLLSGKTPRPVNPPQRSAPPAYSAPSRRPVNWNLVAVALLLFVGVFAITTKTLLKQRNQSLPQPDAAAERSANMDQERSTRPDSNTRAEVGDTPRKANREEPAPEAAPAETITTQPTPAVATVTVTIDPESGLLARADCPLRSRMSYPSGSEPKGYCNISHALPPKESRIKSLATKILPQKRKDPKTIQE